MKPLIGYGSDVSASRPARLVGDGTSTWGRGAVSDFGPGRLESGVLNDRSSVVAERLRNFPLQLAESSRDDFFPSQSRLRDALCQ